MTEYTTVERSTVIAAPAARIVPHLVDFHRWPTWSPWERLDPELKRTYSGPESGVGAHYKWSGNRKAGAGHMTVEMADEALVKIDLVFTRPFRSKSKAIFVLAPRPDSPLTKVVWQILSPKTKLSPVIRLFLDLEKTVGPDLEQGLSHLKAVVEGQVALHS